MVAETDFSFLLFGGAIVLVLFVVIVVSTILCRFVDAAYGVDDDDDDNDVSTML